MQFKLKVKLVNKIMLTIIVNIIISFQLVYLNGNKWKINGNKNGINEYVCI